MHYEELENEESIVSNALEFYIKHKELVSLMIRYSWKVSKPKDFIDFQFWYGEEWGWFIDNILTKEKYIKDFE